MGTQIRVRFAPSPTGYMHVGGARTALFNYLFARRNSGVFILRIEDTDQKRFQPEALKEIYESLRWLGLEWDEGPDKGGPVGPYVQSQRSDIYRQHADMLLQTGNAYRCFCTPERLAQLRDEQQKANMQEGSGYDRFCRTLSSGEVAGKLATHTPHVIRLKIPLDRAIRFVDLIRGSIETSSDLLDDIVLLKSDGFPTYHLANIVDDHLMGVTHVLRGDEWIASTPRHILLYEAFGWPPPQFAHMPVILSPDGGKLSKRKGAASVMDYKNAGYLPESLFNFLALLGWAPGSDREIMTRGEMIASFSLERISPKASVFDESKLDWMNGQYLLSADPAFLLQDAVPRWKTLGWLDLDHDPADPFLARVVSLFQSRAKRLPDIAESASYFFLDPATYEEKAARKHFQAESVTIFAQLIEILEAMPSFTHDALENSYRELAEKLQVSAGKLIHPTRLAVSGVSFGPGLFEMLEVLGKDRVITRLRKAIQWIRDPNHPLGA